MSTPTEPAPATPSLRARMREGVVFWGLGNAASRALRFLAQYILLWILAPSDFGIVAMTTALMNILQMVSESGVGVAVIQRKDLTPAYITTAFWVNLAASMLVMLFAWISAPWFARFYGAPEIAWLVRVTSLSFPAMALRTIPTALMRRNMQFGLSSALETAWNGLTGVAMIGYALAGGGYWSLVVPAIAVSIATAPAWYVCAGWKPSFTFHGGAFRDLIHYAKHLIGASLLALLLSNAGFIIAGHILGKDVAGLFAVATTYASVLLINFAYLVANVSLSGFAARQDAPDRLRAGFMRVYEMLAASTLPVHALGIALAPLIFEVLMPAPYAPAAPAFQLLLALAALRSVAAHVAPFYNAINRAHVNSLFYALSTPICVAVMYAACRFADTRGGAYAGMNALAWSTAATQGLSIVVLLAAMRWTLGWRHAGLLRTLAPYAASSCVAVAAAKIVERTFASFALSPLLMLVTATCAGFAAYMVVLYWFARARLALLVRDALPSRVRERYVYSLLPALRP